MAEAFTWTSSRVDDLKRMILAGESATQIAKRLGCPSRSAVLGKAYRLGLSAKAAPGWVREEDKAKTRRKIEPTPKPRPVEKPSPKPTSMPVLAAEPLPAAEPPSAGSVGLMSLRLCDCRWPYGEGPFLFCGRPVEEIGRPYCAAHAAKARSRRES